MSHDDGFDSLDVILKNDEKEIAGLLGAYSSKIGIGHAEKTYHDRCEECIEKQDEGTIRRLLMRLCSSDSIWYSRLGAIRRDIPIK